MATLDQIRVRDGIRVGEKPTAGRVAQALSQQMPTERLLNASSSAGKNVKPLCPECGGLGYLRCDVEPGHPKFGRLEPCSACNQETIEIESGLRTHERAVRLADIETRGRADAAVMVQAVERFLVRPTGFLSIHGTWGNGKTLALQAIVNHFVDAGVEARYITGQEISLYLRDAFDPSVLETDVGRITKLARVPILCIDEFEKLQETPYATAMQQHLINERYRNANSLGTVLAWNGTLRAIPWPAVVSRMQEFTVVSNQDADLRPMLGEKIGSLYHSQTGERLE